MKLNIITAYNPRNSWKPKRRGIEVCIEYTRENIIKELNFVKSFLIGSIKLSLFEDDKTYYLGFLQGENLFVGRDVAKENFYNETPQQILDNLTKRIENLKVGDVLVYLTERFQELNGENLTTNQEAIND
jgi:hypothetical protein